MKLLSVFFILNSTLILLHEIESAFEKEWEILKLPGKITGFIVIHMPIIFILFYGAIEIERHGLLGYIIALISGVGGILPFVIHKLIFKRKDKFNLWISGFLIYSNIISGLITVVLSAMMIF